jgi:two-component system chemotaxis sensor kinase CheA
MTPQEIQEIFFVECEEALAAAEAGLAACKAGTGDAETVNAIFRAVHSIKGGAGAFGFAGLQAFTHVFETLLSDMREGTVPVTAPLVGLMLRALDVLSDHVSAARKDQAAPEDAALLAELEGAMAAAGESDWVVRLRPHAGAMRNGGEPLLLLRELVLLGGVCHACDTSAVPMLDHFDPQQGYLGFTMLMPQDVPQEAVLDIFDFVGEDCPIAIGQDAAMPPVQIDRVMVPMPVPATPATDPSTATLAQARATPAPAGPGQSIRIDLVKLDRLIDTVGELVIAQAMLVQRLQNDNVGASDELAMLEGLTRDIQESAMSIRAQPIGSVFSRVPRTLRELAASTGKQVNLQLAGESTELDKTVIERLGEPLTHLIRNAIDHGIESPQERIARGKNPEGTLTLSAEHRSGRILIRIADDGAGIDRARVLAKAVEKGLVAPEAQLSREEIDTLIFAPGFSTAASVTSLSGRGVGMDVVRQNVKDLGGRITIESEEGKGTIFTLTLPLTLAISDGMIVKVGDQTLVVPLAHVVESLRPETKDVRGLGATRMMLDVRGRFIPVVSVAHAVGAQGAIERPEQGVLIVVDTESAGQAALLVDNIWDQRQFVIKSLDTHFRSVEGVAGATILGDGRVALILNVDSLVATATASGLAAA